MLSGHHADPNIAGVYHTGKCENLREPLESRYRCALAEAPSNNPAK